MLSLPTKAKCIILFCDMFGFPICFKHLGGFASEQEIVGFETIEIHMGVFFRTKGQHETVEKSSTIESAIIFMQCLK